MKINKIIVSPHLDDACLSAFSILGSRSLVITVFAGIPKKIHEGRWDALCGFKNSNEAMTARIRENELASKYIGFKAINLPFTDWQYKERNNKNAIREKIKNIISDYHAAKVFCPLSFGGIIEHPDHITTTTIVGSLSRELDKELTFYADLPYQAERNLKWIGVKRKGMKKEACNIYATQMDNLFKEFPNFRYSSLLKEAYLKKEDLDFSFPL